MTTTAYTDNTIFTDNRLNQICDLIFSKLVEKFPPVDPDTDNDFVYQHFILSGSAADAIQDPKSANIKNIVFQTDSLEIYVYLIQTYKSILNSSGMTFKERLLFYPLGFYFEVWYGTDALDPYETENIIMQRLSSIPSEML